MFHVKHTNSIRDNKDLLYYPFLYKNIIYYFYKFKLMVYINYVLKFE